MKNVVILTNKIDRSIIYPQDKKYRLSYENMYEMAEEMGIHLFRASYAWFSFKKNCFDVASTFRGGRWIRVRNLKPDLIYDKTKLDGESHFFKEKVSLKVKIVNNIEFTLLGNNKLFTSLILPKYFKQYYVANNKPELLNFSNKIKGKRIVIKPAIGSGGKDVQIILKKDVKKINVDRPLLVQEFIDSSKGIKGIVDGVHDLRLVFIGKELIYSYVRRPAKGSLLANVAQGGTMEIVEEKNLPKSLKPLVKYVQDAFAVFGENVYTIDLMFDEKQRPWIVELNTMPGIYFYPDQKKWQDKFYLDLIKFFKRHL